MISSRTENVNYLDTTVADNSAGLSSFSGMSGTSPPAASDTFFPDTEAGRLYATRWRFIAELPENFPHAKQWKSTLCAALVYAARGLRCLPLYGRFPNGACTCKLGARCKQAGKHPSLTKWQELATSDALALLRFWNERKGRPVNIGIATGEASGVFVIDPDGKDGAAALAEIEARDGALPATCRQITGSGGSHLLFAWPQDGTVIRNSAKALGTDLDVRGEGGYICAAPSTHPNGNHYRWADGRAPWQCEVAAAPDSLIRRAYEATKANQPSAPGAPRGAKEKTVAVAVIRKVDPFAAEMTRCCGGLEYHLWSIGDHAGGKGFDAPLYAAACSYFAIMGPDAPVEPLKFALLERCAEHGPRGGEKIPIERYTSPEYLNNRIEQARNFIIGAQ